MQCAEEPYELKVELQCCSTQPILRACGSDENARMLSSCPALLIALTQRSPALIFAHHLFLDDSCFQQAQVCSSWVSAQNKPDIVRLTTAQSWGRGKELLVSVTAAYMYTWRYTMYLCIYVFCGTLRNFASVQLQKPCVCACARARLCVGPVHSFA